MKFWRTLSAAGLLLLAAGLVHADGPAVTVPAEEALERDVDGLQWLLPHAETRAEREFWQGREDQMPGRDLRDSPPPVAPIRNCAEWEPCTGVLVRYPLGLPYQLLRDFDDDVTLHVIVSSSYLNTARTNFVANGVDTNRVQFLVRTSDSIWTRDYGPWFVFDGDGEIAIIDHEYNRPSRPNDDVIPIYFAQQQSIPVHTHSMFHTGGNYMTDGAHVSASTDLVYDEALSYNGMTPAEVDQLMFDYYGIEEYHVVDDIESGGIHHIDCWAKFLDEETVLVKQVPSGHSTYNALEARCFLLASLTASTGRNYRVHRVYCPTIAGGAPAAYTNSLILNRTIYVPFWNNATYDNQALDAYRAAAPGYDVRGYYYSSFITDDALHCRAKGVMDRGMLRVAHVPVIADQPSGPVTITAEIRAHSGADLTEAQVHYRHGDSPWASVDLVPAGGPWQYAAEIPAATAGDDSCSYYIHVADASGRAAGYPRVESARSIRFWHDGDLTAVGATLPAPAALHPNYPNPFNPATTFAFDLRDPDHVELVVLDPRGRLVRTLIDEQRSGGHHEVRWDGTDDSGHRVASGAYLLRLRAAGLQYTRAVTLAK